MTYATATTAVEVHFMVSYSACAVSESVLSVFDYQTSGSGMANRIIDIPMPSLEFLGEHAGL
jgi:hypothetical protein